MDNAFKCDNCKLILIGLGKFLEHKSKCFFNVTSIDPAIDAIVEPTITTYIQLNDQTIINETTMLNYQIVQEPPQIEHNQDVQQQFPINCNNTIGNASTPSSTISSTSPTTSSPSLWSSHYHTTSTVNEIIQPNIFYTELQQSSTDNNNHHHNSFVCDSVIKSDFNCSQLEQNTSIINYRPAESSVGVIELGVNIPSQAKPKSNRKKKQLNDLPMVKMSTPIKMPHKQKRIRKNPWERKRNYQCRICGRSFHENKLERHVNIHLIWPDTLAANIGPGNFDIIAGNYRCNYCPERIDTFIKLRTHMSRLHKNVKLYMCPMSECRQLFGFQDLIIEHSKTCAFRSTVQCSICSQYFSLTKELDIHLLLEHRKEIGMGEGQPRPKLGVIVSESTNLVNVNAVATTIITETDVITTAVPEIPINVVNNDNDDDDNPSEKLHPNQCPICLVKYRSEVMMLKHLHTDNHKHECEICTKVFINKRALTSHLHIHRDQKAICPVCNRSFKMKKVLHVHMLTHTDRQFICDICGQVTAHKSTIAKHFKIHTNPKEKCLINGCKKLFRHLDRLKTHQEIHKRQLQKFDQRMKSKKKYKKRLKSSAVVSITNDVIQVKQEEEEEEQNKKNGQLKKRMFHFKKNVTIPGIVVESGQITKGIEILKEYTKINTNKYQNTNYDDDNNNNNHYEHRNNNNGDDDDADDADVIKVKFENKIKIQHEEIALEITDDALQLHEHDINDNLLNVKENGLCEWSANRIITDKINFNFIDRNSNRLNLEFVECDESLEKLPDHIVTEYLLKEENPVDESSYESENQPISLLQKKSFQNNISKKISTAFEVNGEIGMDKKNKKKLHHKNNNDKNDKNFEFVECTPIQNDYTPSIELTPENKHIDDENSKNALTLTSTRHEFEDNTSIKTETNHTAVQNQNKSTIQKNDGSEKRRHKTKKIPDKNNIANISKIIKIPKAKSIQNQMKKQSFNESEWPPERLQLFITRLSVKTKTTAKTFECNVCGQYFKATASHLHHVQSHRVWSLTKKTHIGNSTFDTIEKIFRCPFCPETYRMHAPLRSHMAYTHHNEKVYVCPLSKCMELFTDDHPYLLHCRQCVFTSMVRCSICKRFFSNRHELTTHKIVKHKLVDNSDDDDNDDDDVDGDKVNVNNKLKISNNIDNITRIKSSSAINNGERIYECDVCHAKFKTKILFVKHQLKDTHNHKCLYCGMQLFTLEKYNKHIRQHFPTTYAPRMCYICGKIFKSQPVLYLHMSSHTNCFTCDICKKTFTAKNTLMKHLQRHSELLHNRHRTKRFVMRKTNGPSVHIKN